MSVALVALAGALVVGGVWWATTGGLPEASGKHPVWRPGWRSLPAGRAVAALMVGGLVLVVTRWPVAAAAGVVGGWFLSRLRERGRRAREAARTEAIALWAETLRDVAGTANEIEGVLTATAATVPLAIRDEVQSAVGHLSNERLDTVLDRLASGLDHHLGDLVVVALRLAPRTGGASLRRTLDDLARTAYAEAEMRRRVEVARQRPRSSMRAVAAVVGTVMVGLVLFTPDYVAPYRTATGQLVLSGVVAIGAASFWWLHRMSKVDAPHRFLARGGRR